MPHGGLLSLAWSDLIPLSAEMDRCVFNLSRRVSLIAGTKDF